MLEIEKTNSEVKKDKKKCGDVDMIELQKLHEGIVAKVHLFEVLEELKNARLQDIVQLVASYVETLEHTGQLKVGFLEGRNQVLAQVKKL